MEVSTNTMSHKPHVEVESAIQETNYLLQRWEFSISSTGLLWIQPTRATLSPEELAGMLAILARGCTEDSPKVIKLDLSNVKIVGEQWTMVETLILDFAKTIKAQIRIAHGSGRPAASVLFCLGESPLTDLAQGTGNDI